MNAYELAEYLDNNVEAMIMSEQPHLDNAAVMLRQQADRIAELEQFWKDCEEDRTKKCSDCQSAKPVAYEWDYVCTTDGDGIAHIAMPFDKWIELRDRTDTTPQTKPLSDEEIEEIHDDLMQTNFFERADAVFYIALARIIEERHGIK